MSIDPEKLHAELGVVRESMKGGLKALHLMNEQNADAIARLVDRVERMSERVMVLSERTPEDIKERLVAVESSLSGLSKHRSEITNQFRTLEIDSAKETAKRDAIDDRNRMSGKAMAAVFVAVVSGLFSLVVQVIRLVQ